MKKQHHRTLKFHTMYTIALALLFASIIILNPDIALGASMVFLLLYVAGNGIIHGRSNQLTKDTIIEYVILSMIALVVLIGAIF